MPYSNPFLKQQAYLGGEWVDSASGKTFNVTNPATLEVIGTVPDLTAQEVNHALDVAAKAQASWKKRTAKERSAIVERWAALVEENAEQLADLLTAEQGKPLAQALGEVLSTAAYIRWFAQEARRAYGDVIPTDRPQGRMLAIKEPVGVVAAITPWNFPMSMIARKAGAAIACGCACVIKPASETPYSALAACIMAQQAGIPAGLLSVATGKASVVGGALMSHPAVRKLSFTGSTEVGKLLMRQAADSVMRISLELGGNAPLIVFDDADLDTAVAGAMDSKFRNSGQTCVCANRIYVQRGIYEKFTNALADAISTLVIGDGTAKGVTIGPMISEDAVRKVENHIADAVAKGGRIVCGGKRQHGLFMEPTLIADANQDMLFATEETFGPLAPLTVFDDEADAYAMANHSDYGLAAYVFTQDLGRAWRAAEALESGLVGINEGVITSEAAPFGGYKQSGIGREGAHFGLDEYLEVKYVFMGGI